MSKAGRRPTKPTAPKKPEVDWLGRLTSSHAVWGFFAIAALLFYAAPLFEHNATVQWDAVDYHLSVQKYFADHIRSFQLPHWTPYPYSGMPFLADTQVGAWYPLNWPFFLIGITPRAIEWELALHCFLALAGGFFLAREFTRDTVAALFAGVLYAFSGFFAAHSSHVGMFQTAALLPWLILAGIASLRNWRWLPVAPAIAGVTILAGHFQSALYALAAYALFLIAYAFATRIVGWRVAIVLFSTALFALGLTAIQTLPGLDLTSQSIRAQSDFSTDTNGVLLPGALVTLVDPDHYNAPGVENYTGPPDITQFYFYQGVLLLPLAALGAFYGKLRIAILAPAVFVLWYALGPGAGFSSPDRAAPRFPQYPRSGSCVVRGGAGPGATRRLRCRVAQTALSLSLAAACSAGLLRRGPLVLEHGEQPPGLCARKFSGHVRIVIRPFSIRDEFHG